ncbi:SpoIIE family protein phosphatase [Streptomyces sp. NPDC006326]|uniref:PP2C family protein-serine/threonine phosphatase n=1 Tax=Streptomyces sp. NPDC006326 TaxID=3156752 RepID=UPI0033BB223F
MESGSGVPDDGPAPELLALAKVVARLRSEVVDLEGLASVTGILERAKGVVMAEDRVPADVAYETLVRRAEVHDRTLMEECWITLGRFRPASPAAQRPGTAGQADHRRGSVFDSARYVPTGDGGGGARRLPAGFPGALARARTPGDVAALLREALQEPACVDAVLIYSVTESGRLELMGHAGVDAALAAQWQHIPPFEGVAALEVAASQQPLWLEDPVADAERYLLIGKPPGRWSTRAWIPVTAQGHVTTVVGFLRTRLAPFGPEVRSLLQQTVGMVSSLSGVLPAGGAPREERADADGPPGSRSPEAGSAPDAEAAGPGDGSGTAGPPERDGDASAADSARPAVTASQEVADIQAVFDALSGTAILLSPVRSPSGEVEDYRIDAAAPGSVDIAGRCGKELVGLSVLETYPTVAGSPLWQGYHDALTTGTTYEGEPFVYQEVIAGVPEESTYSVRATRLGDRLVVSWIRHDTGLRETLRLAAMQRLGNLGWADWNLTTDSITWSEQVYAIFDRDPALGPMRLEELPEHLVPEDLPTLGAAVERLLGEGRPIDQQFRIVTADGVRHLRIVAEARTDAEGRPVEVHGFFQDRTAQRDAELALHEQERAMLVQRGMLRAERNIAARLRQALLPAPERSMDLAGLAVDVLYVPADSGVNVGGDWYSAIQLPDERALFVVGDVAGHGLDAVGTMAQLRFTAKGMIVTGSTLSDVLVRLNALLLHSATDPYSTTATMVMAHYQPATHLLTWVRAGHLPPLLIRDGTPRFLPQPAGPLLGATFEARYAEATLQLEPGDHLLLYTDGLIEEPGEDIYHGMARLADAAVRAVVTHQRDPLARILAELAPGGRDDVCALAVHVPPAPTRR